MVLHVGWRILQVLADLKALVSQDDALPVAWRPLKDAGFRFDSSETTLHLLDEVESAALDPGAKTFVCATAILLADCIQDGLSPSSLAQNWAAHHDVYRKLTPRERAIVETGFMALHRHITLRPEPDLHLCRMTDASSVKAGLIGIARSLRDDELDHIAKADYGWKADEHLSALNDVLRDVDGWRSQDRLWCPSEVIELISHVPSERGFPGATALLLVDGIERGDIYGDFDFRWSNNAGAYMSLPPRLSEPFVAAFRLLYETDRHWNPYDLIGEVPLDAHLAVIPPLADRYLSRVTP